MAETSSDFKKSSTKTQVDRWREFFEILVLALALALFLRTFIVGFYRISTGSMAPSLRIGDFVWVSKISYGLRIPFSKERVWERLPEKGDLVLFRYPEKMNTVHIKRVLGLPGDHIFIKGKQIYLNDKPLPLESQNKEPYSDISGVDYMTFMRETNGTSSYDIMYAQTLDTNKEIGPLVVPPGEVFLIGDNRDASDDSRYWGPVPMGLIDGKAKGIWFSLDWSKVLAKESPLVRWHRLRLEF